MFYEVLFVFLLFGFVYAEEGSLLKPCNVSDIDCLSKSTEKFLENTCAGIPQYNIKAIDPMIIPSLDVQLADLDVILHLKNLNVTGLKKQRISDFKMDTVSKSVVLATKSDLEVVADIEIEFTEAKKSFLGTYNLKASAIATAKYKYELKKDDKDVDHFEVGQETISCEGVNEPDVTINPELTKALEKDEDIQNTITNYANKKTELRKKSLCQIVEEAYVTVIHNIRAAAKILPKTAFFNDV